MIYWFSGTGNSARVAKVLAERLGEQESKMEKALLEIEDLKSLNSIGFIFPVYGWGLPLAVEQWIDRLPSLPVGFTAQQTLYVYSVLTCGDDIGRTDALLRQRLAAKGWPLQAVFSVQMRNTYVCLPGFDTDLPDLVETKEKVLQERLKAIAACIDRRQDSTKADVTPGSLPWLKTYVLRPLFNRWLTNDRHFHVDTKQCIGCGRCEKLCPLHNIRLTKENAPEWMGHCTHCLACYHVCPKHAIRYGLFTKGKGQVRINF